MKKDRRYRESRSVGVVGTGGFIVYIYKFVFSSQGSKLQTICPTQNE